MSLLVLLAAYRLALNPRLVYLVGAVTSVGVLMYVPVEVFFGTVLLARNVADAYAYTPVAGGMNPGALVGLLAIGAGVLRLTGTRRPTGLGFVVMLVLLLAVWTIVGYANFGIDGAITREFVRVASILVLGLVAAVSVRRLTDADRAVAAVVFATTVPATIAIGQWLSAGDIGARASGTLAKHNAAAGLFGVALALALWRLLERRSERLSAVYLGAAGILAVAILATRSLGGLAQILVTLVAYAVLTRRAGGRAIVATAAVVLLAVFSLTPVGRDRIEEVQTTRSYAEAASGAQTNSLDWRFANWAQLIDMWRERPLLGYGSGTTTTTSLVAPRGSIPHSDVIRLLVETGIIGFLVFSGAFVVFLGGLYRRARAPDDGASFSAAVLAIVAGLTTHGLVNNVTMQTATMYALAVVVGAAFGLLRATEHPDVGRRASVLRPAL
jgi:O-antigen ligase